MAKYAKCTITSGSLNVRKSANASAEVLFTLKPNEVVEVISDGAWYQIEHPDGVGYCSRDYMSVVVNSTGMNGTITLDSGYVYVRTGPGTSFDSVYQLRDGASVKVHELFKGWQIISTSQGIGCVLAKYVSTEGGGSSTGAMGTNAAVYNTAIINANSVNVRNVAGATDEASVVYRASSGNEVQILKKEIVNNYYWYYIHNYSRFDNLEGWIRGDFLTVRNIQGINGTGNNSQTFLNNIRNHGRVWKLDTLTTGHPEIKILQDLLNDCDISGASKLTVNGCFNAATESAVRELQRINGLSVDGIFGANTLKKTEYVYNNNYDLELYYMTGNRS